METNDSTSFEIFLFPKYYKL